MHPLWLWSNAFWIKDWFYWLLSGLLVVIGCLGNNIGYFGGVWCSYWSPKQHESSMATWQLWCRAWDLAGEDVFGGDGCHEAFPLAHPDLHIEKKKNSQQDCTHGRFPLQGLGMCDCVHKSWECPCNCTWVQWEGVHSLFGEGTMSIFLCSLQCVVHSIYWLPIPSTILSSCPILSPYQCSDHVHNSYVLTNKIVLIFFCRCINCCILME